MSLGAERPAHDVPQCLGLPTTTSTRHRPGADQRPISPQRAAPATDLELRLARTIDFHVGVGNLSREFGATLIDTRRPPPATGSCLAELRSRFRCGRSWSVSRARPHAGSSGRHAAALHQIAVESRRTHCSRRPIEALLAAGSRDDQGARPAEPSGSSSAMAISWFNCSSSRSPTRKRRGHGVTDYSRQTHREVAKGEGGSRQT